MKASELVKRARDVADLKNSDIIDWSYEDNSLNEAWKDKYNVFLENDDDYFVNEYSFVLDASTMAAPTGNYEYIIPLPVDFMKLRYFDYFDSSGRWSRIEKFPLTMKNMQPGIPYYRFKGNNLWIISGQSLANLSKMRIGYYPVYAYISHPDVSQNLNYAMYSSNTAMYNPVSVSPWSAAQRALINSPFYITANNTMVYVYNGVNIVVESQMLQTTTLYYTGHATITNLWYYKGYIYFLMDGNIYSALLDPNNIVAITSPTLIAGHSSYFILNFSIFDNYIYYSNLIDTYKVSISGMGITTIGLYPSSGICLLGTGPSGTIAYINSSGNITVGSTVVITGANASYMVTDRTSLYYLDTSYNLHKIYLTIVGSVVTVISNLVINTNTLFVGGYNNSFLAVQDGQTTSIYCLSSHEDTDITFPNNSVLEIMSYQCAVDFMRKQSKDFTQIASRLAELRARFVDSFQVRDDANYETIGNAYAEFENYMWR